MNYRYPHGCLAGGTNPYFRQRLFWTLLPLLALGLAACGGGGWFSGATSTPTPSPSATPTFTPTATPSPTPTPTPLPPFALTIHRMDRVSAVSPAPVTVDLMPPPTEPLPSLIAAVLDPEGRTYARFSLLHQGGGRYVAPEPLYLPLTPPPGVWRVVVGIDTRRPVIGEQTLTFEPAPVAYRPLTETLPSGVVLRVPAAFDEIAAQGDARAGYRHWGYEEGVLELWWAPGPTEPFQRDTALMMLEATRDAQAPPLVSFEESVWDGRTAFAFREGASIEGWVLQDADDWLYVLRLHLPKEAESARPLLIREVAQSLRFVAD
ncbi:MAG: hypothetical protein ACP5HM_15700 [Anaerolineae bacterium]